MEREYSSKRTLRRLHILGDTPDDMAPKSSRRAMQSWLSQRNNMIHLSAPCDPERRTLW